MGQGLEQEVMPQAARPPGGTLTWAPFPGSAPCQQLRELVRAAGIGHHQQSVNKAPAGGPGLDSQCGLAFFS